MESTPEMKKAFFALNEKLSDLCMFYKPVFKHHTIGTNMPEHLSDYFMVHFNEHTGKYYYDDRKKDYQNLPDLLITCKDLFNTYLGEYS
jgi:hypothetical protein